MSPTSPFAPFLLILVEEGGTQHFIIDACDGMTIGMSSDGQFTQTFKWTAHNASKEEIGRFVKARESHE